MVLSRLLRAGEAKTIKRLRAIADHINAIESDYTDLTDAELRELTDSFKERLTAGETTDDILPEAFAVVREAAKRTLGQRHFDVQLMGGAALHLGNIAEMKTGEGKTLVSTLPVYLNALEGKGVHVVTTNDYLAQRDSEWMGRVHRFLGLEVGVILSSQTPDVRKQQYAADVTYGTNNEFGFDYLRDNMAWSKDDLVQRGHYYAVVDEVDSILIDEARTPLIISGPADQSSKWYSEFARLVPRLRKGSEGGGDGDYEVDEAKRTVGVTEEGVAKVEAALGIDNLYESVNTPLVGFLNNALKAKELYKKDRDYIVVNGEVLIVDEFTGRVLHGRRYNEGMHQAIEAKEGVEIKAENQTLATITLQNYFRLYEKLSGMTGTAQTEAAELSQTYKLGVVPIPPNRPVQRADEGDLIYKAEEAKFDAVVEDIAARHEKGQPVLVGTASVEKSELLSKLLLRAGVPHEVLNAKNHAREAAIIAQAGRSGAVTVATNMAGRGTDIVLGGNPDFTADLDLREQGLSPTETPEEYEAAWPAALEAAAKKTKTEAEKVRAAGGLYVLGTERHESRRIDNQLRGRAGRQGDPGESRFYLSLGDDLMRRVGGGTVEMLMTRLRMPDDMPIEHKFVSKAIKSAQTQVEQQNFEIRKNVLKYDEVMNKQRTVIYEERRRVLDGEDLHEQVQNMITDVITAYIDGAASQGYAEDWDTDTLWAALKTLYPISLTPETVAHDHGDLTRDTLREAVLADARRAWADREEALTPEITRELERRVVLSVLDRKWREHLYEMDYLKEGIGLRAMAQRDPLIEYQREGFDMFNAMLDSLKEESVGFLYNLQVQIVPADGEAPGSDGGTDGSGPDGSAAGAPGPRNGTSGLPAPKPVGGKQAGSVRTRVRPVEALPTQQAAAPVVKDTDGAPAALRAKGLTRPTSTPPLSYSGPAEDGGTELTGATAQSGSATGAPARNAPCPCGSGKKYKQCHGRPGAEAL
ncbi:preprotein translocase subunit SecA [Nakamurella panacisegetis]|uniref:Protein translocase subunit SecA n=1 Tax=Nakamurella panacisegetis TaxID=1090615 RepID=A0A1H0I6T3_9ACTN|nr:preprotein translocase subunit SecA [Nakamurella panacisegetis]SDO27073.1 preprotein translocase subunit SecA [Nakamurella panacisegetis]